MLKNEMTAWCVNGKDEDGVPHDLNIWGASETMPHRRLDIQLKPCTPDIAQCENLSSENIQDETISYLE